MKITATGLEGQGLFAIDASHQPGEIAPTFTVSCRPPAGTLQPSSVHLAWAPPDEVTFTINDMDWECTPEESPKSLGGGVTYKVTYVPNVLHVLRDGSYGKRVVWLSCPQWQYAAYIATINEDETVVFWVDSDVYASNGHSVKSILESIGGLCEIEMTSQLPPLHIPQPSLVLDPQQTFLSFINGLLPPGFAYTWDWHGPEKVTLGLGEPAETLSVPVGATAAEITDPAVRTFDTAVIEGAPYKINSGITLSSGTALTAMSTTNANGKALQTLDEVLQDDTAAFNEGTVTTKTTRTVKYGPDGVPFAVIAETQEITGPVYTWGNLLSGYAVTKRIITENTYENDDSMIYAKPRMIQSVSSTSGYTMVVYSSEQAVSNGNVYHLLDDLRVVTRAEFLTLSAPIPDVIASAVVEWVDNYEVMTETHEFITTEDVEPEWPEGLERVTGREIVQRMYLVGDRHYSCTLSPETVLQQIAQRLQAETTPTVNLALIVDRVQEREIRKVKLESPGSYLYEETRFEFDPASNRFSHDQRTTRIQSSPPSQPTEYRTEPLRATLGEANQEKVVYSAVGQVPTANPTDFQLWAGKLFRDMTQPHPILTFQTPLYLVPQGYRIGGGTVTGWQASQQGQTFNASMTVV